MGYKSIHGLMPIQLTKPVKETEKAVESLYKALFGKDVESIIPASKYNRIGSTEAVVVGGNLSLLQSLLGSPCQIKTKNKILFIEEIGEDIYRVDRLLQSLKIAGYFRDLKALIVGSFMDIKTDPIAGVKTYQELILEVVEEYDYPVLFDVPSGHIADNRALILGAEVLINVGEFVSCIRFKQG
jgi:muramoyltetrapeptide carboxypeptidase